MDAAERKVLKEAHRTVVMLRGGATPEVKWHRARDGGEYRTIRWRGRCDWCGRNRWLQCAHLLSVGAHPRLEFDPDNARPMCRDCHLGTGGWHKDPHAAREYCERRGLVAVMDALRLRERASRGTKADPALLLVALDVEMRQRVPLDVFRELRGMGRRRAS